MWEPYFQAQFTKPLVRQLVAILYRDMPSALAAINASYATFAEWDLAEQPVQNFPALLIVAREDSFDEESAQTRSQSIRIALGIACAHQDPNALAEILQDYVRAVDQVLMASWWNTRQDFGSALPLPAPPFAAASTAPGLGAASLTSLFVVGHAYDELRQRAQGLFAKAAALTLEAQLEET